MPSISVQTPRAVVMIRPHAFAPNPETVADNAFQTGAPGDADAVARAAFDEVTEAVARLEARGVIVHLFEDEASATPDSVFPNNWFSTHAGGHVAIYPMYSPSRRKERRWDVIEMLKRDYRVQDVIDYSGLEYDNLFLEGTGAVVLDHIERVAYAARSKRTSEVLLERFCTHFNFEPVVFDACDPAGTPIYHTNVVMCLGTDLALIGLDTIQSDARRTEVAERIADSGRTLIDLSWDQLAAFAGNAIELQGEEGRVLALSSRAWKALTQSQRVALETLVDILPLDIPTIEHAGGSVRCMIAGIHLSPRKPA